MTDIDWKAYYEKEPEVCDLAPSVNAMELHRCMAAWSVFPRGRAGSILDVGCGDGFFCHWIAERTGAARVVGVDIAAPRLERARARYVGPEYIEGALPRLPFRDGEFEVVTCIEVLEHQTDPIAALRELGRVARKHIVVTVPNWPLKQTLCPHCLRAFPAEGHLHSFPAGKLEAMGREAGLMPKAFRSYSLSVGNLRMVLAWPLGAMAAWLVERLKLGEGTFQAGRFGKT